MIVEYIRYEIDPGRTEEFDDAYRRAATLLRGGERRKVTRRCSDERQTGSPVTAAVGVPGLR
jgi:hypothetical protein